MSHSVVGDAGLAGWPETPVAQLAASAAATHA
jgi:hypothetical protein